MRPPDGGRVYYWCTATDETAWEPPTVDGPTIEPTAEDLSSNAELSAPEVSEPDTIIAGSETEDDLNNNPFAALDLNSNVTAMGGAAMTAEAGALPGRGTALLAQFPVRSQPQLFFASAVLHTRRKPRNKDILLTGATCRPRFSVKLLPPTVFFLLTFYTRDARRATKIFS